MLLIPAVMRLTLLELEGSAAHHEQLTMGTLLKHIAGRGKNKKLHGQGTYTVPGCQARQCKLDLLHGSNWAEPDPQRVAGPDLAQTWTW